MARVRGGNTGYAVALVIFGCAFVITLLVAIILYTKIEAAENGRETAEKNLAQYVSSAETAQANDYITGEGTVFGNLRSQITALEDTVSELQRDNAALEAEVSKMETAGNTLESIKTQLEEQLAAKTAEYEAAMNDRMVQVNDLGDKVQASTTQVQQLGANVQQTINAASQSVDQSTAELNQTIAEREATILELRGAIADLESANRALRDAMPKAVQPNTTTPDGRVASVFSAGRDLFIDLGRSDGVVMGMTFEVFDPNPVIRLSTQGEARGKATIEVYALDDESATCRVVRMVRGEQIDPGDPVVNVAYDPNMDIKMFAFGDFDIERDGGPNDIERIKALIVKNGASVPELEVGDNGIPVLTPDIDYIVLGERPELPEKPDAGEFDPEVIAAYQAKLAENEAYFNISDAAKQLGIPVLNQNRFLDLIGYYVR